MKHDLRFEALYPYPRERVWRALTNSEELAQWLMSNNFEPRPGHRFQFHDQPRPGFSGTIACEIIEFDEPHRLAYKWSAGDLNTIVRFLLEASADGGTRLILEQVGFDGAGGGMISALIAGIAGCASSCPPFWGPARALTCNPTLTSPPRSSSASNAGH